MTTPGITAPDGSFVLGGRFGQDITQQSALATMSGDTVDTYTNVQNSVQTQVTNVISGQSVVLSNHENRITVLESGDQIAEYNSNDTWSKPADMKSHRSIAIAGGGGGRSPVGSALQSANGGFGGGQGGFAEATTLDASMPSTVAITIGAAGAGAQSDNTDGGAGGATSIGSIITAGGGPGGTDHAPSTGSGTHPEWAANGGQGGGDDNSYSASSGGNGYLASGGLAGTKSTTGKGGDGGNGNDCPSGQIGPGSGGGGGGGGEFGGGNGGNGGFPGGAGGGGGKIAAGGPTGRGGNGANGRGWIISSPHE